SRPVIRKPRRTPPPEIAAPSMAEVAPPDFTSVLQQEPSDNAHDASGGVRLQADRDSGSVWRPGPVEIPQPVYLAQEPEPEPLREPEPVFFQEAVAPPVLHEEEDPLARLARRFGFGAQPLKAEEHVPDTSPDTND